MAKSTEKPKPLEKPSDLIAGPVPGVESPIKENPVGKKPRGRKAVKQFQIKRLSSQIDGKQLEKILNKSYKEGWEFLEAITLSLGTYIILKRIKKQKASL